jgi:hypothetical protein
MRGLRMALGLVGVFGLSATAAADPAIYLGGGVGQYHVKVDDNSYTPPAGATAEATLGGSYQDSPAVWRVFAGYQFGKFVDSKWMPNIAVQADYLWYSTGSDHVPTGNPNSTSVSGDGYEVSLRPSYPLASWVDIFARVGYQWYNIDVKTQYIKGQSDSNNELMYSGGFAFHFTPHLGLTTEYEVVNVSSGDLNAATVSLVYTIPRG